MGMNGRRRMFLSEIGNRRSPTTRVATGVALAATFFGTMRIGWATGAPTRTATPPAASPGAAATRRVRPVSLDDVSGKVPSDTLWKLFDGDAATGLDAHGDVRLRMTFSEPIAVTTVGGFGVRDGRLVLHGSTGATGGETADAGGPGWTRVAAKQPEAARTFIVEWSPGGPNATLSELEVWGRLEGEPGAQTPPLADALFDSSSAPPAGAEVFAAPAETHVISPATASTAHLFTIAVPRDPRSIERAFLAYELDGLAHFTSAIRRLNGASPVGGFAASWRQRRAAGRGHSPAALRSGPNVVEFLPINRPFRWLPRRKREADRHARRR